MCYVAKGYWADGYAVCEDVKTGGGSDSKKKDGRKILLKKRGIDDSQEIIKRQLFPEDFAQEPEAQEVAEEAVNDSAKIAAENAIAEAKRKSELEREIKRIADEDEEDVLILLLA